MRLNDGKVSPACEAGPGTAGKLAPQCRHRTHAVQKNTKFHQQKLFVPGSGHLMFILYVRYLILKLDTNKHIVQLVLKVQLF